MKNVMLKSVLACCVAGSTLMLGCETGGRNDLGAREVQPSIGLQTSSRNIVVGDVTTLSVTSQNTVGRDAQVEWTSTGGVLQTEENGRLARVRFDQPGTYTVSATLLVDGREYDRQTVNINVRPIR